MSDADCVLVDGTFWTDDEMIAARRVARRRARDMGHLPQSGAGRHDRVARAAAAAHAQDADPHQQHQSDPRRGLRPSARSSARAGIEVAYDGMEIEL